MTVSAINELTRSQAALEERMKTMQAEYKTDIARLAEEIAKRETRLAEDNAGRETSYRTDIGRLAEEMAKRETRLILAVVSMIALGIAILRFTE